MANSLAMNRSQSVAGLGTFQYTCTSADAGEVTVAVQSTIPRDPGSLLNSAQASPEASALQIVIKQNGSSIVTIGGSSTNPTQSQPALGTSTTLQCSSGDVIAVVFSSANSIDAQPNTVKSVINLYQGK